MSASRSKIKHPRCDDCRRAIAFDEALCVVNEPSGLPIAKICEACMRDLLGAGLARITGFMPARVVV